MNSPDQNPSLSKINNDVKEAIPSTSIPLTRKGPPDKRYMKRKLDQLSKCPEDNPEEGISKS